MFAVSKRAALLAAALLVFVGGVARASTIEVKVPFRFDVHGKMMPAGRYLIDDEGTGVMAIRGEQKNPINMFVMTTPTLTGHDPAGEKPSLTFTRGEAKTWKLAGIWESGSEGRRVVG